MLHVISLTGEDELHTFNNIIKLLLMKQITRQQFEPQITSVLKTVTFKFGFVTFCNHVISCSCCHQEFNDEDLYYTIWQQENYVQ